MKRLLRSELEIGLSRRDRKEGSHFIPILLSCVASSGAEHEGSGGLSPLVIVFLIMGA